MKPPIFLSLFLSLFLFFMTPLLAKPIETDSFIAKDGKEITVHFIQHASLYFTYSGMTIYIDPVSYEGMDYNLLPKADVILVTHDHYDHFNQNTIAEISTSTTKLFCNSVVYNALGKGVILENGQKLPFQLSMFNAVSIDIFLEAVPAYNTTEGRDIYHPKGRDNGYIITLGGTRIYIPGDCEAMSEMADLNDVEVAFLPINQPYTMTVEQAIHAAQIIKPKILYPIHYSDTNLEGLSVLKEKGISVRIFKM